MLLNLFFQYLGRTSESAIWSHFIKCCYDPLMSKSLIGLNREGFDRFDEVHDGSCMEISELMEYYAPFSFNVICLTIDRSGNWDPDEEVLFFGYVHSLF